jgi:DNA-binding PadR family transcriptional regulator
MQKRIGFCFNPGHEGRLTPGRRLRPDGHGMRGFGHGGRMRRGIGDPALPARAAQRLPAWREPSRSGGAWRLSPGSVYPALQLLADEGLIRGESREGGTVYELTDSGRAHVEEHRERLGTPWEQAGADVPEGLRELGQLIGQVAVATKQVMQAGNEAQTKAAAEVLTETRRSLYRILAEE